MGSKEKAFTSKTLLVIRLEPSENPPLLDSMAGYFKSHKDSIRPANSDLGRRELQFAFFMYA